jgi:hypothetical protein
MVQGMQWVDGPGIKWEGIGRTRTPYANNIAERGARRTSRLMCADLWVLVSKSGLPLGNIKYQNRKSEVGSREWELAWDFGDGNLGYGDFRHVRFMS